MLAFYPCLLSYARVHLADIFRGHERSNVVNGFITLVYGCSFFFKNRLKLRILE